MAISRSSSSACLLLALPLGGCLGMWPGDWAAWMEEHRDDTILIPAGTFTMGSPDGEVGRVSDETEHEVTLTHGFYIGIYEVTQAQFEGFMGYQPACYDGCPDCPVECVTWHEAAAFANAVSEAAELAPCYSCDGSDGDVVCTLSTSPYACEGYRLPTEAEWEYAARADTETAFSNGGNLVPGTESQCSTPVTLDNGEPLGDIAVYCGYDAGHPEEVGSRDPNPRGLYDMHGNVWEWVGDDYAAYDGPATDPAVDGDGGAWRSFRGGSWGIVAARARSANRNWWDPGLRNDNLGFRLVRLPSPSR